MSHVEKYMSYGAARLPQDGAMINCHGNFLIWLFYSYKIKKNIIFFKKLGYWQTVKLIEIRICLDQWAVKLILVF